MQDFLDYWVINGRNSFTATIVVMSGDSMGKGFQINVPNIPKLIIMV